MRWTRCHLQGCLLILLCVPANLKFLDVQGSFTVFPAFQRACGCGRQRWALSISIPVCYSLFLQARIPSAPTTPGTPLHTAIAGSAPVTPEPIPKGEVGGFNVASIETTWSALGYSFALSFVAVCAIAVVEVRLQHTCILTQSSLPFHVRRQTGSQHGLFWSAGLQSDAEGAFTHECAIVWQCCCGVRLEAGRQCRVRWPGNDHGAKSEHEHALRSRDRLRHSCPHGCSQRVGVRKPELP